MTTLREAAEASLDALKMMRQKYGEYDCRACDHADVAIIKLCAALEEPEQEPVAWRTFDGEGGYDYRTYEDNEDYAAEWAKRNPWHVGWVEPLYTAPPQRKPLTHEEIVEAVRESDLDWQAGWTLDDHAPNRFDTLARAIERAHGIGEP